MDGSNDRFVDVNLQGLLAVTVCHLPFLCGCEESSNVNGCILTVAMLNFIKQWSLVTGFKLQ